MQYGDDNANLVPMCAERRKILYEKTEEPLSHRKKIVLLI